MALNYRLFLEDEIQNSELSDVINESKNGSVASMGINILISRVTGLALEIVKQDFEFTPLSEICFAIDKESDINEAQNRVSRIVNDILIFL